MTILFVVIALSFLVLAHEGGHFAAAKWFRVRVDEFGFGFPPKLFSKTRGETRYSLNLFPFGGFVRIFGEDAPPPPTDPDAPRAFVAKPLGVRALIIGGGIVMNVIVGWLLISLVFMTGAPSHLGISEVAVDSPAAAAGIQAGDLVVKAEAGATALTDPIALDSFVRLVGATVAEKEALTLTLKRGGNMETVSLTGRAMPPEGEGALGVGLFDAGLPQTPFFESLWRGAVTTAEFLKAITVGLFEFFIGIFTRAGTLDAIRGPVGIVSVAASSAAFGLGRFLNFVAIISLHLAILNFLPIPALDGGRLLFLAIEGLKGSPVSRKVERATHAVGFALLLLLMVVVTARDIGRLIP